MESIISDYEILIKLRKAGIKFMSAVPFVIYTTDFVMHEMRRFLPGDSLTTWINVAHVETISEEETPTMLDLMDKSISLSDCSVLFLAKRNNWKLATESESVKKKAFSIGVMTCAFQNIYNFTISKNNNYENIVRGIFVPGLGGRYDRNVRTTSIKI